MKESISNAIILNVAIIFLFITAMLFAGSTAYTKAFKVKNRIINIIERNESKIISNKMIDKLPSTVEDEIEASLSSIGYRAETNHNSKCQEAMKNRFKNKNNNYSAVTTRDSTYNYCIAVYNDSSAMHGRYYAVITYMYFEVPLIGSKLEFPVYGETKTMGLAY